MTESTIAAEVRDSRQEGVPIDIAGTGTLLSQLPPPPVHHHRLTLEDHRGITGYDPAELTVAVRAGTTFEELDAELAVQRQECPIDGPGRTIGGRVASGLSGLRRLSVGHLRDWILGALVVTAEGKRIRLGAPTVKNVTGYDLPRLCCASWGTLVVLVEITLRVRPRPLFREWFFTDDSVAEPRRRLARPASIVRTRTGIHVLLEGHPEDCRKQARGAGLTPAPPPSLPEGARLAVPPGRIDETLAHIRGAYAAEAGVGIIHADPPPEQLPALRHHCERLGGRLLVLRRGAGIPPFGGGRGSEYDSRLKLALDPTRLFAPWRFAA